MMDLTFPNEKGQEKKKEINDMPPTYATSP
jgi:hypothetical protein